MTELHELLHNDDVRNQYASDSAPKFAEGLAFWLSSTTELYDAATLGDVIIRRIANRVDPQDGEQRGNLIAAFDKMITSVLDGVEEPLTSTKKDTISDLANFDLHMQEAADDCLGRGPSYAKSPPDFRNSLTLINSVHILIALKAQGFEDACKDKKDPPSDERDPHISGMLLDFAEYSMTLTVRGVLAERLMDRIHARVTTDAYRSSLQTAFLETLAEISLEFQDADEKTKGQIASIHISLHKSGEEIRKPAADESEAELPSDEITILRMIDRLGHNIGSKLKPLVPEI